MMRTLSFAGFIMAVAFKLPTCFGQAIAAASGPGSNVVVGGGVSAFNTAYGRNNMGGVLLFVDTNPQWRLGFEGEARFLRWHADEEVTEANFLGGLRMTVSPRPSRFSPYLKLLAGAGRISLPFHYAQGGFLTYAPGVGLDIACNDRVTVRAVDFEYQHWPQFTYGAMSPYGISSGISLRLNGLSVFPKGPRARRSR